MAGASFEVTCANHPMQSDNEGGVTHELHMDRHNTPTNLSFDGASSTPCCHECWEDDEPTRGSKLHKLTEIEGDGGPVQRKSHCNPIVLFCYGAVQKWARVAICLMIHALLLTSTHVLYGGEMTDTDILNIGS